MKRFQNIPIENKIHRKKERRKRDNERRYKKNDEEKKEGAKVGSKIPIILKRRLTVGDGFPLHDPLQ